MALKMRCLSDDETLVQQAAFDFCKAFPPSAFARPLRDGSKVSIAGFWCDFSSLGFAGVRLDPSKGGTGLGHVAAGQIAEALGRQAIPSPFIATTGIACDLLMGKPPTLYDHHLRAINDGNMRLALAFDERGRHAHNVIETQAHCHGDSWVLSGQKRVAMQLGDATHLLVSALLDGLPADTGKIGIFLIPVDQPGVILSRRENLDGSLGADISLDGATVSQDALISSDDGAALSGLLDVGRAYLCAELLGLAEACFIQTVSFLKQREQFGAKLSSFQALQHRCAQLYADLQLARSAVLAALLALESQAPDTPLIVSVAKAKLGKVTKQIAHEAMQLHGGISMTDAFDLHFFTKRIWVCDAALGDDTYHSRRVAELLGY
jgi:alkylation response protein AidB-like acyl-CoA dehydrogenase